MRRQNISSKTIGCLAILLISLLMLLKHTPTFTWTDFNQWHSDFAVLKSCLSSSAISCKSLSYLSSGYLLNSALLSTPGHNSVEAKTALLTALNAFFLVLPIICFANFCHDKKHLLLQALAYLSAVLVSVTSSYYVKSGALELQAGVLWGIFMLCFFNDKNAKIPILNTAAWSISLFLFLQYKDTNIAIAAGTFIFSVIYYITIPKHELNLEWKFKRNATLFAFILLAGLATTLAYNMYRYGSILPESYAKLAAATKPSTLKSMEFFLANLFSPNGGFLVFWAFPTTLGIWASSSRFSYGIRDTLAIGGFATLIASTGLSLWWAPFGWDSFGNRLILPLGLGLVIATVGRTTLSGRNENRKSPTFRQPIPAIVATMAFVSFCYCITVLSQNKQNLWSKSLFEGPSCTAMIKAMGTEEYAESKENFWRSQRYYDCARERFLFIPGATKYPK